MSPGFSGDEDMKKKNSRRQKFFTAITQFSIRQTLDDIEKTFKKQSPHVIQHYTAGVRLYGLTSRQMERQMEKMQKSATKHDSPYAKPLLFVHMGNKKKILHTDQKQLKMDQKQLKMDQKQLKMDKALSCRELDKSSKDDKPAVANLGKEIKDTMKLFADQKSKAIPRLQEANLIMQLRQNLGDGKTC